MYGHGGRSCKKCSQLASNDFAKGIKVKIRDAYDCGNCSLYLSRPSADNVVIVDLYSDMPMSFDYHGNRVFKVADVVGLMELREVEKDLFEDYYNRVVFLHNEIVKLSSEKTRNKFKSAESAKRAEQNKER